MDREGLIGFLTRRDILDLLTSILVTHVASRRYMPQTAEAVAYHDGFYAALKAVALGAGLGQDQDIETIINQHRRLHG